MQACKAHVQEFFGNLCHTSCKHVQSTVPSTKGYQVRSRPGGSCVSWSNPCATRNIRSSKRFFSTHGCVVITRNRRELFHCPQSSPSSVSTKHTHNNNRTMYQGSKHKMKKKHWLILHVPQKLLTHNGKKFDRFRLGPSYLGPQQYPSRLNAVFFF